jgi:hypothetical protein
VNISVYLKPLCYLNVMLMLRYGEDQAIASGIDF